MKKKLYLIIYFVMILIIVLLFSFYYSNYLNLKIKFLEMNWFDYALIFLFHCSLGVLIGIPYFITYVNSKEGNIRVDYEKIIILGIPSIILSTKLLYKIIGLHHIGFYLLSNTNLQFFRIFLGYIIITSISKEPIK